MDTKPIIPKPIIPNGKKTLIAGLTALIALAWSNNVTRADTPETVCTDVKSYSLKWPKVFWHDAANCMEDTGKFPARNIDAPEVISRVAAAGGLARELLNKNPPRPPGTCNTYHVYSDVVADNDHVYWVDDSGLVRLSENANVGDPPQLQTATVTGGNDNLATELAIGNNDNLFARTYNGSQSKIYIVSKASGVAQLRATLNGRTTQLSYDGKYLYYLLSGTLWRLTVEGTVSVKQINTGVTGYHAEGRRNFFPSGSSENVWFAKGRRIYRYDNVSNTTSGVLYTSTNSNAVIYSMTSIGGGGLILIGQPAGVYFLERRTVGGGLFNFYDQLLFRIPRGGGAGENLYFRNGSAPITISSDKITNDGTWLYWQNDEEVLRIAADAAALPKTNMRVTGLEVTQTIQNLQNTVPLIEGKRTFVRMHIKSDDPANAVPNVYAHISATWNGGQSEILNPINTGGRITVHPNPDRKDINHSFLFEIPIDWTKKSNLRIYSTLNPHHLPLQNSYANNQLAVGPFSFLDSPRLELEFFAFRHEVDGTEYAPDYTQDVLPTMGWIRRVYPLASNVGGLNLPGPGLRPRITYVFDGGLGARVNRTHPDCLALPEDEISLCAVNYINAKLGAWRSQNGAEPYYYYGLIKDAPQFPRGRKGGDGVASGPAGPPGGWDTDSTYADWYTGHELGHTLGRGHPVPNSDDPNTDKITEGCGHSRSDAGYPYAGALIGPPGEVLMGFDSGWQNLPKAVLPSAQWADMMSYCNNQWISDYTYNGIYNRLLSQGFVKSNGNDGNEAAAGQRGVDKGGAEGPWLSVFGNIHPTSNYAMVSYLRKVDSIVERPPAGEGNYTLELLNSELKPVGVLPFVPQGDNDEGPTIPFGVVMPWNDQAAFIRIINNETGDTLFERAISKNSPRVTGPGIPTAGGKPIHGIHQMNWNGTDGDGDELSYDVLCSHDGGKSFLPLFWSIQGPKVALNTDEIGGGDVIFRVIGTDGILCDTADTKPISIALKPPTPRITSPAAGTNVEYGQLLTFVGEADDPQDGSVLPQNLVWTGLGGNPVTGDVLSVTDLPVGSNTITLRATNSSGLSSDTSITVIVTDELRPPGAMLSVAPLQVDWEVRTGGPNPSPMTLNISNAGGGGINWTASETSSWLSLSSSGGTAPSTLTFFANRNNLPPGHVYETNVTIASSTNPPQTYVIPVTLSIDVSSFIGPIGPLNFHRDRDRDCLPDWWEAQYAGFRPDELDGGSDGDCDGLIDLLEYAFGTDPTEGNHLECKFEPVAGPLGGEEALLFSYVRRINEPKLDYEVETSSNGINWNTGIGFVQELNSVPQTGDLEKVNVLLIPEAPTAANPAPTTLARVRVTGSFE